MSQSLSSGNTTVSGNVTTTIGSIGLPAPTANQTIVSKYIEAAATGTTIHTVTAGKTFYCTGYIIGTKSGTPTLAGIVVNGVRVSSITFLQNTSQVVSGGILFVATTGQVITNYYDGAGTTADVSIWGFEQ